MVLSLASPAIGAFDECNIEWHQVSPATSPGTRLFWATAFDSRRNVAVVFGGDNQGPPLFSDETWEFSNNTWTLRNPPNRPSARKNAAMAFDSARGVCVLFGGGDNVFENDTPQNDTWEYDGNNWTQRQATDYNATDRPRPFDGPQMVYDSARKRCVLVAASDRLGGNVNLNTKTWEWDGTHWIAMNVAPPSRYDAAIAYDAARQVTLLHGGTLPFGDGYPVGDTWAWNGTIWAQVSYTGATPRQEHAMAYDERRQVVTLTNGRYGGVTEGEMLSVTDTWEWNGTDWTLLPDAGVYGLSPRRLHHMWYDRAEQRLISFGGTWSDRAPDGHYIFTVTDQIFEARPPGEWVDFQYTGATQNGFFYTPFKTLGAGVSSIQAGCTLNLKPGTTSETLTITKAVRLEAYSTPVSIGIP